MKDRRYKHLHCCSECRATRNCVESECIGDGSVPPPEGYLEICAECGKTEPYPPATISRSGVVFGWDAISDSRNSEK